MIENTIYIEIQENPLYSINNKWKYHTFKIQFYVWSCKAIALTYCSPRRPPDWRNVSLVAKESQMKVLASVTGQFHICLVTSTLHIAAMQFDTQSLCLTWQETSKNPSVCEKCKKLFRNYYSTYRYQNVSQIKCWLCVYFESFMEFKRYDCRCKNIHVNAVCPFQKWKTVISGTLMFVGY